MPGAERLGGVAGDFAAEQVAGHRDVEVRLALQERQVDDAELAHRLDVIGVLDAGFDHRRAGRLDRPLDAGLADEHVMGFLGQHEPAGARQRIEAALGERGELHLAVAVGEEGEHEERQPVGRAFIEGAEDARVVHLPALALEQGLRLLAPVLAEIFDQEIDHRPEMAALLDIDLEEVAHVVEARRGRAEEALLLDRGRLGVALDDDEPAQQRAVLARHFLPGGLALCGGRTGSCGPRPSARAECPSDRSASSHSRTWPSRQGRRRRRCADRPRTAGSRPGPCRSTSRDISAASPRARAGAACRKKGRHCWE